MESRDVKLLELIFDGSIKPRDVKLSALQIITKNFSEERIIGEGGFATVYKGILRNGEVAVKRIKNKQTIDEKLFRREVNSLLNVSHKNVIRFLGFCSHTEHKALDFEGSGEYIYAEERERVLCFEYISNGSLVKYIADELRGLPWDTRVSIIKGICEGLQYLHMEKQIIHMDLKPANILIDNNMVAKITDFGLSRMEKNTQTKSTTRVSTPGYSAPEYIDSGKMSVKYDVHSLGIIIIELVTGSRNIPDSNNVLRRWRHRLRKSGKETPCIYQQIVKLIEIGLLCQVKDPYKRPFISDIMRGINELESMDRQISNADESTAEQISQYVEDTMLGIEPLELRFPFQLSNQISCSIELTNETNYFIAFSIQKMSPLPYCIQPNKGTVDPRSKRSVNITLQTLDKAPQDRRYTEYFIVWSTKVNENLISEDITEDIFNRDEGKLVDEVNLTVTYSDEVRKVDVSLGSLTISDTRNLHCSHESIVVPTNPESKTNSNELIQFDPPKLSLPLLPNQRVLFSAKIVNITDQYISFRICTKRSNSARYNSDPSEGILAPFCKQVLLVTRIAEEKELEDTNGTDKFFLWNAIVTGVKASDVIDNMSEPKCTELSIVLTKINSSTSDELIQLDPAELCMPYFPNKHVLFMVNIVNTTDFHVAFNVYTRNAARFKESTEEGILLPRSTERCILHWKIGETESVEDYFVWNRVVTEAVESEDIIGYMCDEESKKVQFTINMASPCTSNELIQFYPPELLFTYIPNKQLVCSVNIVNNTDYYVGFHTYDLGTNVGFYEIEPEGGVMPPRAIQRLVVEMIPNKKVQEDLHCKDKLYIWSSLVSEHVEVSDIFDFVDYEGSKELPIVYQKTNSNELIQFDPSKLCLPLLPNHRVLSSAQIVNITDQYIGYRICTKKTNSARYNANPSEGILPPLSAQVLLLTRIPEEKELEDTQCTDKILVWNGVVTEDVKASDLIENMSETKCTVLPIVFAKTNSSMSDELIQFDPPELQLPFLPNKKVTTFIKIVNLTDYNVGFNTYGSPTNAAWYHTEPPRGILLPRSTQKLMVTREEKEDSLKDKQLDDKYFVWKSIVSEGVEDSDLIDYMAVQESMELPIVLDKICSSIPDELIQLDPTELCIPLLLEKGMLFKVNIVNTTDFYVAFNAYTIERNAARRKDSGEEGILPPRSTKKYTISWTTTKSELEDVEPSEDYFVWSRVVTAGVETGDIISYMCEEESKKLPYILNKASPCTSNELIQFNPPELSLPFMTNRPLVFSVNIVNSSDYSVGFDRYHPETNVGVYYTIPAGGVMPPRSTQRLVVKRVPGKNEQDDMQCEDKFYIWSSLVSEGVEVSDFDDHITYEESKKLPIAYKKSLCTSDELIQFDPPELPFPFLPNKRVSMLRKFKITNVTDHIVGFSTWAHEDNSASYVMEPRAGILPPQSTQAIKVRRTLKGNETEDMQCKDKIFVWNGIVTEDVQVSDVAIYWKDGDKELPVLLTKPGESNRR